MSKFTTYVFALFISFAAFGQTNKAWAPPIGLCVDGVCDDDYNFTTFPDPNGAGTTFDSMFVILNDQVDSWMFVSSYLEVVDFDLTPELAIPQPVTLDGFVKFHFLGNNLALFILNIGEQFVDGGNPVSYEVLLFSDFYLSEQGTYATAVKVPEPASLLLFGAGLISLGIGMRRRRKDGLAGA